MKNHNHVLARLCVLIFLAFAQVSFASQDQEQENPPRMLRVAVCQTLCIASDRDGNIRRIENALEQASQQGAQLACFPETAVLGWTNVEAHELAHPIPGQTTDECAELARKHNMMICVGVCEKEGENLYDAVVLIDANGSILAKHRKVNILSELMDPPYTPGDPDDISVVETPVGRIGMLICADTFKDELVARIKNQAADLLLVPYGWAADPSAWPEHGENLKGWVAATARRAGCPVVGTDLAGSITSGPWEGKTYGGQSVIVYPDGTTFGPLRDRDVDVQTFTIQIGATPSERDSP